MLASNTYATILQDRFVADFMIDCTGLDNELALHPLLIDLRERYHLSQNLSGQLGVTPSFELAGFRNRQGRVYLAGVIAFGNDFAPVDSFLGLQYAAQWSVDALFQMAAPGLGPLNSAKSLRQWWRWWQGITP